MRSTHLGLHEGQYCRGWRGQDQAGSGLGGRGTPGQGFGKKRSSCTIRTQGLQEQIQNWIQGADLGIEWEIL